MTATGSVEMRNSFKRSREGDGSPVLQDDILVKRAMVGRGPENVVANSLGVQQAFEDWGGQCPYISTSSNDDMELNDDSIPDPSVTGIDEGTTTSNICYGALCDVKAQVISTEGKAIRDISWAPFHAFKVSRREDCYYLLHGDAQSSIEFAILDLVTSHSLRSLRDITGIVFTAILSSASLRSLSRESKRKKTVIDLSINLCGPESLADDVGVALIEVSKCLQHPDFLELGMAYVNPHYFYPGNQKTDLRHLVGPARVQSKLRRVERELEGLLDSLTETQLHTGITSTDQCDIHGIIAPYLVDIQLKSHQIDGVRFILNREDSSFCQKAQDNLVGLVDPSLCSKPRLICHGGILADIMGLGKTMTMLSAIAVSKLATSNESADNKYGIAEDGQLIRQTLIVLPSSQVLDVWNTEIKRRFSPEILKVRCSHGDTRAKQTKELSGYDIILTTYHTLAADWKRQGILQRLNWFRVVLDEAHWVRNQSTGLFKAAESLQCEKRWCLTGTPIQNSLDDLRSLLMFLHFEPFCTARHFEKHIVGPIRSNTECEDSLRNLRLLLQVVCLRRTETALNLPPAVIKEVPVSLSSDEKATYQTILAKCLNEFDKIASTNSDKKKFGVLFTTVIKLRRLCNHGNILPIMSSDPQPALASELPMLEPDNQVAGYSLGDIPCDLCGASQTGDLRSTLGGVEDCPICGNSLVNSDDGSPGTDSPSLLLSPFYGIESPLSEAYTPDLDSAVLHSQTHTVATAMHSSKLAAVIDNLYKTCLDASSKSIVFTSWCHTLDILARMLSTRGIQAVQIDGRVPFASRSMILSTFSNDPTIRVLLMSIGTGAVGLTLTNANFIHIVEPQWNPAVEEQAIARAVRMGQTRSVTVLKYVTEQSVEKNIVKLQKSKTRLAKFSLHGNEGDNTGGTLDDLKFILNTNA